MQRFVSKLILGKMVNYFFSETINLLFLFYNNPSLLSR